LSHFPLNHLLPDFVYFGENKFCPTEQEFWDMVLRRPDVDKGISEVSEDVLCRHVNFALRPMRVKDQFRAAAVEHLPDEKWRLAERQCKLLCVCSISQSDLQKLDELIEKGFDPKYVTRSVALEKWEHSIGARDSSIFGSVFIAWTRTTVENLAARGLPVDCDCVPAIDDKYTDEKHSELYYM